MSDKFLRNVTIYYGSEILTIYNMPSDIYVQFRLWLNSDSPQTFIYFNHKNNRETQILKRNIHYVEVALAGEI